MSKNEFAKCAVTKIVNAVESYNKLEKCEKALTIASAALAVSTTVAVLACNKVRKLKRRIKDHEKRISKLENTVEDSTLL